MYPPHHLGGYELTWRSSVTHLREMGHEVRVLTSDYRSPGAAPRDHGERDVAGEDGEHDVHRELRWYWRDHEFPFIGPIERLRLERHNGRVLGRHLAQLRPHAVAWWAMGGMSLSIIERVRLAGIPAVGVVGDLWMLYGPKVDGWSRLALRLGPVARLVGATVGVPATLGLGAAARWLFVSEMVRQACLQARPDLTDTAVLRPGINPIFASAPRRSWRGRLLYVGRLDERKGIDTALDALEGLPRDITLTVVGDGDRRYARSLKERAAANGLRDRVSFSAQVAREELAGVYADADALLFPVVWPEPWGLVPLEAMACGTPVIATGTGGSGEYLRDGDNCLLAEPGNAQTLGRAVARLAADAELRERLCAGGFQTAARYTEQSYNSSIEAALLDVARR
jgi:glycogen synthase